MLDLNRILLDMQKAALQGEDVLNAYFGRVLKIEKKLKAGLVTQADRESEQVIESALRSFGYDFLFLGEESFQEGRMDFLESDRPCWILDPLDGTTNFVHGFPVFAISLALYHKGQIQVGLVNAPKMGSQGERYWAVHGQGAFFNGEPIRVSEQTNMEDAFLATGFFAEDEEQLREQLPIFENLVRRSRAIRRAGAAAYDLALVARGVFDAFWERGLKPWDTAAGSLLVQEAGGQVQSYRQKSYHPGLNSVVAGNTALVTEIQKLIGPGLRSTTD